MAAAGAATLRDGAQKQMNGGKRQVQPLAKSYMLS
jgi:hypothetical protein